MRVVTKIDSHKHECGRVHDTSHHPFILSENKPEVEAVVF